MFRASCSVNNSLDWFRKSEFFDGNSQQQIKHFVEVLLLRKHRVDLGTPRLTQPRQPPWFPISPSPSPPSVITTAPTPHHSYRLPWLPPPPAPISHLSPPLTLVCTPPLPGLLLFLTVHTSFLLLTPPKVHSTQKSHPSSKDSLRTGPSMRTSPSDMINRVPLATSAMVGRRLSAKSSTARPHAAPTPIVFVHANCSPATKKRCANTFPSHLLLHTPYLPCSTTGPGPSCSWD